MAIEDMLVGQDGGHPLDSPMTRQEVLEVLTGFRDLVRKDVQQLLDRQLEQLQALLKGPPEGDEQWKA